jgi:hypothetical protein
MIRTFFIIRKTWSGWPQNPIRNYFITLRSNGSDSHRYICAAKKLKPFTESPFLGSRNNIAVPPCSMDSFQRSHRQPDTVTHQSSSSISSETTHKEELAKPSKFNVLTYDELNNLCFILHFKKSVKVTFKFLTVNDSESLKFVGVFRYSSVWLSADAEGWMLSFVDFVVNDFGIREYLQPVL